MKKTTERKVRATGGCLCGAVRYTIHGPLRDVVACHCGQCQRTHGNYSAYTMAQTADIELTENGGLHWYQSSETARRGFCRVCGTSLFWEPKGKDTMSIAAGSLDQPTGLKTIRHIFVADAGDYYEISDGLEKLPGSMREA